MTNVIKNIYIKKNVGFTMVNIYANITRKTDFEMEEKGHLGVIDIAIPENRDDANKNNPSYIKEYLSKKWNGIKRMQFNFCNTCGIRVTNLDGSSRLDNISCTFVTIVLIYLIVNPLIYIIFTCLAFTINNDDIECMCRNGAYRVIAVGFGFTWLFLITCGSFTRNPQLVVAIYFLMSFGNLLMGRNLCFGPANANNFIQDPDNYTCVFDELVRNTTTTLQELTSPAPN